ncbi:MAG TPA: hypothetical protein V6D00_13160 [Pantanalinema sp.]
MKRRFLLVLLAGCLLAACEEVPTGNLPASSGTNTTTNQQNNNQTGQTGQTATGKDAGGTIDDGKVVIQFPDTAE